MLFTQKTLATLEYDKIIDMLVELCSTEGARAMAKALIPSSDYDTVILRQTKTFDVVRHKKVTREKNSRLFRTARVAHWGLSAKVWT